MGESVSSFRDKRVNQRGGQHVCDRAAMGKGNARVGEISRAYVSVNWFKTNVPWESVLSCQELPLAIVQRMDFWVRRVGGVES